MNNKRQALFLQLSKNQIMMNKRSYELIKNQVIFFNLSVHQKKDVFIVSDPCPLTQIQPWGVVIGGMKKIMGPDLYKESTCDTCVFKFKKNFNNCPSEYRILTAKNNSIDTLIDNLQHLHGAQTNEFFVDQLCNEINQSEKEDYSFVGTLFAVILVVFLFVYYFVHYFVYSPLYSLAKKIRKR